MEFTLRCFYLVFLSLIIPPNVVSNQNPYAEKSLRVRVRRQDGYVYEKPNMSFDLPLRSITETTQAPNVDRTLTQHTFYTYPAPAGGDTSNFRTSNGNTGSDTSGTKSGNTLGTGASIPTDTIGSGYNYRSSEGSNVGPGYNYGSSGASAIPLSPEAVVTNTRSQINVADFQSTVNAGSSQANSGYGNNVPSPTLSPSLQETSVSTNAPRYLPPSIDTRNMGAGDGAKSGVTTSRQITTSAVIPSDNYLPQLDNNAVSLTKKITSISTGGQVNSGISVSLPSSAYLPPVSDRLPSPASNSNSQPDTPAGGYIPPSNTGSNSGTVFTPAAGYLPPRFF